ncbi:MAG TPA: glycoside hydrolase family 38 C-terminal domain-containing protein, partial [Propionibacteriaceae bacterium]
GEAGRPVATPDRTLHMVGSAHIDPVWLWPWQEGYQEARATFASAVARMEEYPDFVFTCNQVVLLSWVEESDPALFEQIRQRVAEGRWQLTGGWWVEPDCNLPGGESFVRQGLYGQRWLQDRFGVTATVGMNLDPFGHHAMLPQILRGQGMDSYVFLRPGPHETEWSSTVFWWESPDGSRVLAYRIPHEYGSPPGDVGGQAERSLAQVDRSLGDLMIFYGVGNHGGGPTRANLDSIHRYDAMGSFGRMTLSSPRRYLDELAEHRGPARMAELPVWTEGLQHHAPGCYSAHSGIKLWQRRAQAALLSAERWAVVATLQAAGDADSEGPAGAAVPYPRADLERAWKQVLFNQFHDVLPGSAIESAYVDARDQLGEAVAVAKRILTRAHNTIARQIDIRQVAGTQPVVVFNPHPWAVTSEVELNFGLTTAGVSSPIVHVVDGEGVLVPSQAIETETTGGAGGRAAIAFDASVPALGYRVFRVVTGPAAVMGAGQGQGHTEPLGWLAASRTVLENDFLRVEIDPVTGWLTGLLDHRTGVDLVRGASGEHTQVCADPTDTWGHRVVSYNWPGEPMQCASIVLVEAGPLRARLRIQRTWGHSLLVEELLLGHRSEVLEVRVTLDWHEQGHLLKLRFPVALQDPEATLEIPFGFLSRPLDGAEEPGQSWVDLTGVSLDAPDRRVGLAVVNNAKHGYDMSPAGSAATSGGEATTPSPSIGITAVRSPVYSWHDPKTLDPEKYYTYQDQGLQRFRYLLVPHAREWRAAGLTRRAAELGAPVRAMLESAHPGPLPTQQSYVDDGGGPVMITAVKGSEDAPTARPTSGAGDLIVRAVETTGSPVDAELALPLLGRTVTASFGPHQLRTFRVPADVTEAVSEVNLLEWPSAP